MVQTMALCLFAGLMGTNALPHLIKGLSGEEFPTVLGNSPVRNALAGVTGILLAALAALWADLPGHPWAAAVSAVIGAYAMAAFHGLRGAFWLNTVTGRSNPAPPASRSAQGG
ncbi:hypothetical protein ACH35V_31850 [Actinomadura sp. 1N219]|uniref:hypothetical protein n=1 Tax=Actinomadura sp. 1N219 TaxID=3375152 RepID=UPI0037A4F78B